jgi:hypothetical protein
MGLLGLHLLLWGAAKKANKVPWPLHTRLALIGRNIPLRGGVVCGKCSRPVLAYMGKQTHHAEARFVSNCRLRLQTRALLL